MGIVTAEIIVSADPLTTFRTAREVEQYPKWMPSVKSVEVLERRDDGYSKVAWVALAKVASINKEVKWIEEEMWNEGTLSSTFDLLEGDYTHYKGDWVFTRDNGGTKITLTADYDLGLPLVGPLIGKLLDKIMKDNLDGMLKAIKERSEGASS
jgi:ribosome-associated toxin RatA of RatAB toxin-antitoxin module